MLKIATNEKPETKVRKATHVVVHGNLAGLKVALVTLSITDAGPKCVCEILEGKYVHRFTNFRLADLQEL